MSRYGGFRINRILTEWDVRKSVSAGNATAPTSAQQIDYSKVQGIWSLRSTVQFPKTNNDPYFANVSLLLRGDGNDNGTSFIDSSNNNFIPTVFGNTKTVTSIKKYGSSSIYFDGTGDYLSLSDNGAFDFGTGDFTIESWVRPAAFATDGNSIIGGLGPTNGDWVLAITSTTQLRWGRSHIAWDVSTSGVTFVANTWYHVAVSRSGSSLKMFVDGIERAAATNTNSYSISNSTLGVGTRQLTSGALGGGNFFNGYIDDLRVTKGVARYTTSFTPTTTGY